MAVARKIAYNVAAGTVSKILQTILALVSIGFITRYLGTSGFGNYATVLAFLSFFASIADLGLYSISTREISREGADEENYKQHFHHAPYFGADCFNSLPYCGGVF
jgi:O-antigen/teichoic acid export membrane protein